MIHGQKNIKLHFWKTLNYQTPFSRCCVVLCARIDRHTWRS